MRFNKMEWKEIDIVETVELRNCSKRLLVWTTRDKIKCRWSSLQFGTNAKTANEKRTYCLCYPIRFHMSSRASKFVWGFESVRPIFKIRYNCKDKVCESDLYLMTSRGFFYAVSGFLHVGTQQFANKENEREVERDRERLWERKSMALLFGTNKPITQVKWTQSGFFKFLWALQFWTELFDFLKNIFWQLCSPPQNG